MRETTFPYFIKVPKITNSVIKITIFPRCTYKHLSLFSLIKRWDLNWGTLTCELFTDPAGLSSSFKRASSRNNHNRHVELSEVTGIVGIPNSEMKNTHSASCQFRVTSRQLLRSVCQFSVSYSNIPNIAKFWQCLECLRH